MLIEGDEGCYQKTIDLSVASDGADTTGASSKRSKNSNCSKQSAGTKSVNQQEPSASSTGATKRQQSYKPSASPHWEAAKRLVAMYMTLLEGQFTSMSLPNKQRIATAQRSCLKILDGKAATPEELEAIVKYAAEDMKSWPNGPFAVSNFFGHARRWHEFKLKQGFPEKLARAMRAKTDMAEKLREQDNTQNATKTDKAEGVPSGCGRDRP